MTTAATDQPDPELHTVGGPDSGYTYETPLTLGPDSDHAQDPIRQKENDESAQNRETGATATAHPVGEGQARENAENDPPG